MTMPLSFFHRSSALRHEGLHKRVLSEPKPYCNKCVRRVCPTEGILEMPSVMPFLGLARSSYSARQGAPARSETRLRVVTSWSSSSQKAPSERQLRPRLGPEVVLHSKGRDGFRCVCGSVGAQWERRGLQGRNLPRLEAFGSSLYELDEALHPCCKPEGPGAGNEK